MATIRCTVANCVYWGDRNYCTAANILVMAGGVQTGLQPRGENAEKLEPTPSAEKSETMCYTFEPL